MTDKTQEIVESLKGAVSRCSATGRVLVNATMLLEAKREIERLAHEADALLDALRQVEGREQRDEAGAITNWKKLTAEQIERFVEGEVE